jgi:hypothetical protein
MWLNKDFCMKKYGDLVRRLYRKNIINQSKTLFKLGETTQIDNGTLFP